MQRARLLMCLKRTFYVCVALVAIYFTVALFSSSFADVTFIQKMSLNDYTSQACVHPNLPLWNDDIRRLIKKVKPIKCTTDEDWVYTRNGKFYISSSAQQKHGEINCTLEPIINKDNHYGHMKSISSVSNGSNLLSDAFEVLCQSSYGHKYKNVHACIAPVTNTPVDKTSSGKDDFNVLFYGFDSLSRQMFKRLLPKTHSYFTESLGGMVLEGYNIVGDATLNALLPILTGLREHEIPEAVRRGRPGAKYLDQVIEFVWKIYEKNGYVTSWTEDEAELGKFHRTLTGFKNQPVHHYGRPFYLAAPQYYKLFPEYCQGSKPRHQVYINWIKECLETNRGKKFFTFAFCTKYTHNHNDPVILMDDYNVDFFKYLRRTNILENTFVFVMGDHGYRMGSWRGTEQGKLEERMPYFGIYVPPKYWDKYPERHTHFITNQRRLTNPFDIYSTLLDIINETKVHDYTKLKRTPYSLFSKIPKERTCSEAGIEPIWCACLNSTSVSVSDLNIVASAVQILRKLNALLQEYSNLCHQLSLKKITRAEVFETSDHVLKFKTNRKMTTARQFLHYQITFVTTPGNGLFEATVTKDVKTGDAVVNEKEISRLNTYGNTPTCIIGKNAALRPYCVCK